MQHFTFKGCSWRPIPAHPRCADRQNNGIIDLARSWGFDWYAYCLIVLFRLILITLSIIRTFAFKRCSWQPIPAYPYCADWYNYGAIKYRSSRAFNRYAELRMVWAVQNLSCNVKARHGLVMDLLPFHLRPFTLSNSHNIETVRATESLLHSNWSFLNVDYKPHQVLKIILRKNGDIMVHTSFLR